MFLPDRETYRRLAAQHDVVPVALEVYADLATPISAFMALDEGQSHAFLLESVAGGERLGRYSFLGVGGSSVVRVREGAAEVDGQPVEGAAFDVLSRALDVGSVARVPGLPRFVGGAVGYVGYEMAADFEKVPRHPADPYGIPDAEFVLTDVVVAFDHARRIMQVIAASRPGDDPDAAYDSATGAVLKTLARMECGSAGARAASVGATEQVPLDAHTTKREFLSAVARAKEYIAAGDIFQVVLSQRFSAPYSGDGLDLYRVLRAVNPSPYMFYVRSPDVTLVGSSPEPLVRVERDTVLTRPLAGTRPRGVDIEDDGRLRMELLSDDKEKAEHVMLVDLGRNDLGRVSEPGTVEVTQLMEVEDYSHVMHIVSTVTGRMRPDADAFDALKATFPAGTVSGAPKIRAMEIIRELESHARGPYAGTVGYVGYDGAMDMCITIRTFVICGGRVHIQSGAGIVADSDPEREYEETIHKARALHRTLEMAAALGDDRSAAVLEEVAG
ncbi:MAG: anthranilate synthase component I [Coriobacteriia bacterium]